jgi:hypothetical protein
MDAPQRETLRDIMARMRRAADSGSAAQRASALFRQSASNIPEALDDSSDEERGMQHPLPRKRGTTTTSAEDLFDSFLQQQQQRALAPNVHSAAMKKSSKAAGGTVRSGDLFQQLDKLCGEPSRHSGTSEASNNARSSGGRPRDLLDLLDAEAPATAQLPAMPVSSHTASSRTPLNPLTARVVDQLNRSFDQWRGESFCSALRCRALKITVAFHVGVVQAVIEAADALAEQQELYKPGDVVCVLMQFETFGTARIIPGSSFDIGRPYFALPQQAAIVASFCVRQTPAAGLAGDMPPHREDVMSVLAYDPLRGAANQHADGAPTRAEHHTSSSAPSEFHEGPGREWFVSLHILQELLSGFEDRARLSGNAALVFDSDEDL